MDTHVRPSISQLACESCRRRKSKCDKKHPQCGTCARLSQQCVFPVDRLKPGPKEGPTRSQALPSTDRDWISEQAESLDELFGAESSGNHLPTNNNTQPFQHLHDFEITPSQYLAPPPGQLESAGDYWDTTTTYMGSPSSWSPQMFFPLAFHESSNCRAAGLNALVHPVHENLRTLKIGRTETANLRTPNFDRLFHQISIEMKISSATLLHLIDLYLSHVMVLSLFHKPSFKDKLNSIQQPLHLKALLASVCSYAARIEQQRWPPDHRASRWHEYHGASGPGDEDPPDPQKLHTLAIRLFADAMRDYEEETPPLCLLQACIINTSYSMTHGVYGKACRSLGLCIQLAYESNLHVIDFELYPDGLGQKPPDLSQWSQDEEARRAWWAIWEMDSYSSSIRRCPGSLRTSEVQTLLPVSDEMWFQNRHQNSVFLSSDIFNLINAMQETGNESPLGWLIIAITLMREAQSQSNYTGALWLVNKDKYFAFIKGNSEKALDATQTTQTPIDVMNLTKKLQGLKTALPESLQLNGPLTFTSAQPTSMRHTRQQHSAIYNIAMMIEMARYMAHHFLAIQEVEAGLALHNDQIPPLATTPHPRLQYPTGGLRGVQSCIDAADNIVDIVSRSAEEQVLYTNSFNVNVIALAASVKLVQKAFDASQMEQDLVQTKVEVLRATMRKSVEVWDAPQALLKNLDFLGERVASGHIFDE